MLLWALEGWGPGYCEHLRVWWDAGYRDGLNPARSHNTPIPILIGCWLGRTRDNRVPSAMLSMLWLQGHGAMRPQGQHTHLGGRCACCETRMDEVDHILCAHHLASPPRVLAHDADGGVDDVVRVHSDVWHKCS